MFPQRIDPGPGHGAGGEQRNVLQAVGVEQLSQMSQAVVQIGSAHPIRLVQHNHHYLAVPGKWLQIAVMHRRIRIFLRIQHPDKLINDRHHPVHLGSVGGHHGIVIWQIQQHHPPETVLPDRHLPTVRYPEPVQELGIGVPKAHSKGFSGGGAQHPHFRDVRSHQRVHQR